MLKTIIALAFAATLLPFTAVAQSAPPPFDRSPRFSEQDMKAPGAGAKVFQKRVQLSCSGGLCEKRMTTVKTGETLTIKYFFCFAQADNQGIIAFVGVQDPDSTASAAVTPQTNGLGFYVGSQTTNLVIKSGASLSAFAFSPNGDILSVACTASGTIN